MDREHFICESEGPNNIGEMWAETAVARQLEKGATDEIEVAFTMTRRGIVYSAEELEAIRTADPQQYKRIMRRRSMSEKVCWHLRPKAESEIGDGQGSFGLVHRVL
jgi:hypothetical protein